MSGFRFLLDVVQTVSLNPPQALQSYQRVLEVIASLSYRSGELTPYLRQITYGVCSLLQLDWSIVTLCRDGYERVLASSIESEESDELYDLHGTLTGTVIQQGCPLIVEDTAAAPHLGEAPEGYRAYLGVPLRTSQNTVIGTICSFHTTPRPFTPHEVKVAELLAERAATAIDNYLLYQAQLQFNERLEQEVQLRTQELQQAQAQLMHQTRLAAIGEFAAGIVHEIRNPFTTVKLGLTAVRKLDLPSAFQERLRLALDEADRLERLLSEVLLYAKPHQLHMQTLDWITLVRDLLPSLREMPEARSRSIDLVTSAPRVMIQGDRDKLKQVLINLVRNACEAVAPGEPITCRLGESAWAGVARLEVHNGGAAIAPDILAKLTQPFFSTKSSGTGLGLAISQRIVEAHGGHLSIVSRPEIGTIVEIQLPLIQPPEHPQIVPTDSASN